MTVLLDTDTFFSAYRAAFGALNQNQVDGLNALIDFLAADADLTDPNQAAYVLATIKHETANTFLPIAEYGHGKTRAYGLPDPETGQTYYGRGYVQLTWRRNYQRFAKLLNLDLDHNPDLAMDPANAWAILSIGMRTGLFTGKKLDDYITETGADFIQSRRIINGLDQAALIAKFARQFENILNSSQPV